MIEDGMFSESGVTGCSNGRHGRVRDERYIIVGASALAKAFLTRMIPETPDVALQRPVLPNASLPRLRRPPNQIKLAARN
jgi:hypothetical protein